MKKEQVLAKLRSCGLVAVVRAKDADDAMRIAEPASRAAAPASS